MTPLHQLHAAEREALREPEGEAVPRHGRWSRAARDAAEFGPVLDACCGSRMFWFNRKDPRAVFVDKREEQHTLKDASNRNGSRELIVSPDIIADFTALPFEDETFALVAFDPPHLTHCGRKSWLALKYGVLDGDWREHIRKGFAECFRVLRPLGTLIFKWNERDVPVSEVLALTPEQPLFGNRCGKTAQSHWLVFLKPEPQPKDRKAKAI